MNRYAIEIVYSEEDEGYVAVAPELPGCSAFGRTPQEALREVTAAVRLWLDVARREGRRVPRPHGRALLAPLCALPCSDA